MQTAAFLNAINDPHILKQQDLADLQRIVQDFPYFQTAHLLLTLGARQWDPAMYQQTLKRTAIVVPDRSHLFNLLAKLEKPAVTATSEAESETRVKDNSALLQRVENAVADAGQQQETAEPAEMPRSQPAPEKLVESEIARQVVTAFVEKEIIKTPELHKPQPQAETHTPESFGDWLNFLKKNNGQPYQQIEEEVNKAREKKEARREEAAEQAEDKG